MLAKAAGNTPVILDCQPDGRENFVTAGVMAEQACALIALVASLLRNVTRFDGCDRSTIFDMDGLVVRGRLAKLRTASFTGQCAMSEVRLIQSIERAAAILEIIAEEGGAARLQHIAEQAKLGKTTAHNLLKTLDELGYVRRRAGDTRYHLGGRILNLARIAGDDGALRSRLRPVLESVAKRTGEMVTLAVPSGDEVYYLDAIDSTHALKAGACPIGVRLPLEGSAVGLVSSPSCQGSASVFSPAEPTRSVRIFCPRSRRWPREVSRSISRTSSRASTVLPFPGVRAARFVQASD